MSITSPAQHDGKRQPDPRFLHAVILLLVATDFLQSGMIAFAAGPIMAEIGASPEQFSLVVAAYASVAIVVISQQRALVEKLGWRAYVAGSLIVFSVGAGICAASHSLPQFTVGRLVMGAGGASFVTASRVMINLLPAGPGRFKGVWFYATGLSIGGAAAPFVASVSIIDGTWSDLFVVLIVLAAITGVACSLCLTRVLVPQARTESSLGLVVLLAGGSFALLYVFQRATYDFYSQGLRLAAIVLAGAVLLGVVVRRLALRQRPMLDVGHMVQRRFLSGLLLYAVCYLVLGATNYTLPMLLQKGLGFPWYVIGHYQAGAALVGLVTWWITARVLPRHPAAGKFYLTGFLALAFFGWQLGTLSPNASFLRHIVPALAANSIFMTLVLITAAIHTFKDMQADDALFAHGQQVKNMVSQLATSSGTALAAVGLQWRLAHHYASLNGNFASGNEAFTASLSAMTALWSGLIGPEAAPAAALAQLAQTLTQQATLLAAMDYFLIAAFIGIGGAIIMPMQKTLK